MRRALGCLLAAVLLASAVPARAFVSPRWNAQRESRRSVLMGKWSTVSLKEKGGKKLDAPGILLSFTATELRLEEGQKTEKVSWKLLRQDGDLLELDVWDDKGRHHAVDVLVEGSDALTMYFQDDDGDDDVSLRLERVH